MGEEHLAARRAPLTLSAERNPAIFVAIARHHANFAS